MPSLINGVDLKDQIDCNKMQLEYLELAGGNLERYITREKSRPSFLEITGISSQRTPTCSGLNAGDYRNLATLFNHSNLSQLKVLNKVPLPAEIMEHFAHMQSHCLMGVFPEINRVWLTIDRNIYIWAFEHGSDVAYFDGLVETIVSVGLVKPKPGVFQNFVKYLLVLTTPVEIVVLGVTFSSNKGDSGSEFDEMHLVPEPVFVLPTDGVSMMFVKSTSNGRIFMGGKDGCLYEVVYQAQSGWFGEHCKKVNHSTSALSFLVPSFINAALYDEDPIVKIEVDNSRNILYTLSEKGCIEVFYLGEDGLDTHKITSLSQNQIVKQAVNIIKTLEANNFKPVISISAVESSESEYLNLVAVTKTGARLYFSTSSINVTLIPDGRPSTLFMIHVRMPPGFTPNASVLKPKQVHTAVYENGTLVMVCSSGGGEAEWLWCLSRVLSDPTGPTDLATPTFGEAHSLLPLDGPVWALTHLGPLPDPHADTVSPALSLNRASRWAVVWGGGACVVSAGAGPDLLRSLLRDCGGPDAQPVRDFFMLQSPEQACACAVYLACEEGTAEGGEVAEWAARAYLLYGGLGGHGGHGGLGGLTQHGHGQQHYGSPAFSPRQMSTPMTARGAPDLPAHPAHPAQPNHTYLPQSPYRAGPGVTSPGMPGHNMTHQPAMPDQVEPSAKHNGLYIYVGRILAPIWNLKCVTTTVRDNQEFMSSNITGSECAVVSGRLRRVAAFMHTALLSPAAPARLRPRPHQHDEHASLHALHVFISVAIEMLSLWRVLCEHQFHVVVGALPAAQHGPLQAASFRELLVGGQEVACLLLNSLVAGYLRDNASVDGISHKLRQLCPTLYRHEDAACTKANELLMFAKQQKNPAEKEEMLQNALKLCKEVAPNVNLPVVCRALVAADWYSGVLELCLVCARRLDPHDRARTYYTGDRPAHDREGHLAYYRRMEIYREVCMALERLYENVANNEPKEHQLADDNVQGRRVVCACLSSDDELLHVAVYEWLINKRLGSELLSLGVSPPRSLREYLERGARVGEASSVPLLDLLWKVLQQAGHHLEAAAVLEGLATKPGTGASLSQRLSWVSAGLVCVRGAGAGAGGAGGGGGELSRRLEELAEVGAVQAQVARALPTCVRLQRELLELTQLYEEYADRHQLWECKLAIVHCSQHNDPLLLDTIWGNILDAALATAPAGTPEERVGSVLAKLASLAPHYSGAYFPLYFIVRHVELMSCKLQADPRLVFRALLNMGVSLEQLLDIYIKLVSVEERVWLSSGDELHVARVCTLLLEHAHTLLHAHAHTHAHRRLLARCKDLHEAALCALQARPNTMSLIDRLAAAQTLLDRMD